MYFRALSYVSRDPRAGDFFTNNFENESGKGIMERMKDKSKDWEMD